MIVIVVIISIVIMSILTRPSLSLSLGKSSLVGPSGHRSAPGKSSEPLLFTRRPKTSRSISGYGKC